MENTTTQPNNTEDTSIKSLNTLIDELNDQVSNDSGEWINHEQLGLVWVPNNRAAAVLAPTPSIPPLLESVIQWGNTYDFDNIPLNSVIIIKLNMDSEIRAQMMQRVIAKQVLEPRIEVLKAKRICILFMQEGDNIQIMTEEEMGQAGWEKKDKSLIINPFGR